MRCYPEALTQTLAKNIAPVYLLYGPEAFLLLQSALLIREKIYALGEVETLTLDLTVGLDPLLNQLEQSSLFATQRLVEIPIKKWSAAIVATLNDLFSRKWPDLYFLIQCEQLTRQQQQGNWFKTIEKDGVVIGHWPLSGAQFTRWAQQYAQQRGLNLKGPALQALIYYTEGNHLATAQEIDRRLLENDHTAEAPLSQQSQFVFADLCTAALQSDAKRVIKIISCVKETGSIPVQLMLWSLAQLVILLLKCNLAAAAPTEQSRCLQQAGVRPNLQPLYLQATKRMSLELLTHLRYRLAQADKALKSGGADQIWQPILEISLGLTGLDLAIIR